MSLFEWIRKTCPHGALIVAAIALLAPVPPRPAPKADVPALVMQREGDGGPDTVATAEGADEPRPDA